MMRRKIPTRSVADAVWRIGCLAGLLLLGSTASAADIRFDGVLPNGGFITKRVVSIAEARYVNLVRQQTDYSCGAASLATILRYAYGMDVDEQSVLEGLMQVSNPEIVRSRGFSLLDLKNYVESLGMRARGYRINIERLKAVRIPSIVMLDINGYKHFVVLKRIVDDLAFVADPVLGNKAMPIDEFTQAWSANTVFAVIGNHFKRDGVLTQVKKPPSARRWLEANGPITESELLDFGFTHADFF